MFFPKEYLNFINFLLRYVCIRVYVHLHPGKETCTQIRFFLTVFDIGVKREEGGHTGYHGGP